PVQVLRPRAGELVHAPEVRRGVSENGGDHLRDVRRSYRVGLAPTEWQLDPAPLADGRAGERQEGVEEDCRPHGDALGQDGESMCAAGEGRESAVRVSLSGILTHPGEGGEGEGRFALPLTGPAVLSPALALAGRRETGLLPLRESALAFVGTLLTTGVVE